MRRIAMALAAAALAAPAMARAGLVLGIGTGLSSTGGEVFQGAKVRNYVGLMVPVQLEAGWKLGNRLTLGGFAAMNFGLVSGAFADTCAASGDDCLANQTRVGAMARWNFMPAGRLDPWVGAGGSWEVLGIQATSASGTSGVTTNYQGMGWDVQAGLDYHLSRRFSVSPYLAYSFGTYAERKAVSAFGEWEPIAEKKAHYMFTVGVRLGLELFGAPPRHEEQRASP